MLDIILLGGGGFSREVYGWARHLFKSSNHRFKGFIDDNPNPGVFAEADIQCLGSIHSGPNQYQIQKNDRFVYAIGNIGNKRAIIEGMKEAGAIFTSLIHPTAVIADTAEIGEGVVICPFALVSDKAVISDFTMINFYASCAHDSHTGNYSILSPYATLNGFAELGDEVFLGTHATVTPNCKIGRRTKISANSVAMSDIPSHSIVQGVPGTYKRIFFDYLNEHNPGMPFPQMDASK